MRPQRPHQALEEELAAFTGRARALVFSSGYAANLGVITTLLGRQDGIFEPLKPRQPDRRRPVIRRGL